MSWKRFPYWTTPALLPEIPTRFILGHDGKYRAMVVTNDRTVPMVKWTYSCGCTDVLPQGIQPLPLCGCGGLMRETIPKPA